AAWSFFSSSFFTESIRPGSSAAHCRRRTTRACAYARFSGGYIGGVPPVPIPNTAVKPSRADGTARFPCGRVGRCRNFSLTPRRSIKRRGASLFTLPVGDRSPVVPPFHAEHGS